MHNLTRGLNVKAVQAELHGAATVARQRLVRIAGRKSLEYLADTIYPRDQWMHRCDISVATGKKMTVTAAHAAASWPSFYAISPIRRYA